MNQLLILAALIVPSVAAAKGILYRGAWGGLSLTCLLLFIGSCSLAVEQQEGSPIARMPTETRYGEAFISDSDYRELVNKCERGIDIVREGINHCQAMKEWNAKQEAELERVLIEARRARRESSDDPLHSILLAAFFGCFLAMCFWRKKK